MASSEGDGKIIHVHFGTRRGATPQGRRRSRGRVTTEPMPPEPAAAEAGALPEAEGAGVEPMRDVYSRTEVQKLLGASTARLRALEKNGVAVPSVRRGTRRAYTFQDLISLRTALGLLSRGVKVRDVVRAVEALKAAIPRVKKPLLELKVLSDGSRVVVRSAEGTFEPTTGQMVLDFDVRALREDVVRVLRPAVKQHRARMAFEIYRKASDLDEDPKTMEEAARLYRQAIEVDPLLAIAYTNLGNILFRKGDEVAAEALYSKALAIDPRQPEAKYNLGYLMLERHELDVAIKYFQGAIEADPRFADAYFNLARAYEELGDRRNARPLWRTYLELEPSGTWADIARQHLG
jgi:tetratricopeptide (TPR) repeat protein